MLPQKIKLQNNYIQMSQLLSVTLKAKCHNSHQWQKQFPGIYQHLTRVDMHLIRFSTGAQWNSCNLSGSIIYVVNMSAAELC